MRRIILLIWISIIVILNVRGDTDNEDNREEMTEIPLASTNSGETKAMSNEQKTNDQNDATTEVPLGIEANEEAESEATVAGEEKQVENENSVQVEVAVTTENLEEPQADQPSSDDVPIEDHNSENENKIENGSTVENTPEESKPMESIDEVEPQTNTIGAEMPPEKSLMTKKCFGCVSTSEPNCMEKPKTEVICKAMDDDSNGCYTLVKVESNVTTRGCISELTTEGLDYCKSNKKFCSLCFEEGCNHLKALSVSTSLLRPSTMFLLSLGILSKLF